MNCIFFWLKSSVFSDFSLSDSFSGVSCGDPGTPFHGKRIGWLFQYNDTVSFKCFAGYVLEGPQTRTCLANQTWSETQPICKRKLATLPYSVTAIRGCLP